MASAAEVAALKKEQEANPNCEQEERELGDQRLEAKRRGANRNSGAAQVLGTVTAERALHKKSY